MKKFKLISSLLAAALIVATIPVTVQAEVTYEEKDSGTNIGQSFTGSATVTFGQTPSFTIKIPKIITLDTDGVGKYTVGVKGQIPSKYTINVIPDETIIMEEENGLLDDITADVTAGKTEWKAAELNPDTYAENTENTIQMQSIDYGKFEGTLNFNVSAKIPVELKDASDEVKAVNKFLGSFGQNDVQAAGGLNLISKIKNPEIGSIIYLDSMAVKAAVSSEYFDFEEGYYKVLKGKAASGDSVIYIIISDGSTSAIDGGYLEYLGESYPV